MMVSLTTQRRIPKGEATKPYFALDYEGLVCNPAVDLAWLIYRRLVSEETKRKFPEELIQTFDEYDDMRWKRERARKGHSTGTTPLVCDCVAACDGIYDNQLIPFSQSLIQENPGIKELIEFLMEQEVVPYFVTNSYPALALTTAYRYKIPSSNVFTHGYQISLKERRDFDRERRSLYGDYTALFEVEVFSRSLMSSLTPRREELERFLRIYLESCSKLLTAYKQNDEDIIAMLEGTQRWMLNQVKDRDLRRALKYMFLTERAIMGGHNKARILQRISPDGRGVVYLGNDIVDSDALALAQYGFAVNCTDSHALRAAKLGLVVPDFSLLVPLFEDILTEKFSFDRAKGYERSGMRVFLPDEVRGRFDYVRSANNEVWH